MENTLTKANLEAGILLWLTKTQWPTDFHNSLYQELDQLKKNGLDQNWWEAIVYVLSRWKAIRPLPKSAIYQCGLEALNQLGLEHERIHSAWCFSCYGSRRDWAKL
jgi:hypothetical protein